MIKDDETKVIFAVSLEKECWIISIEKMNTNQLDLVRLCLLFLLSLNIVICARGWGRKVVDISETEEKDAVEHTDDGEGTYNPKNAWMFVDSRRRVLPDIDGKWSSNHYPS